MKDIVIYGAGGFGREVYCLLLAINKKEPTWNCLGFYDDTMSKGMEIGSYGRVLGGCDELNQVDKSLSVVIAVGTPKALQTIHSKIVNPNIDFPNIIHPSFAVADERTMFMGIGNIIVRDCYCSCDVCIGNFNVLNASVAFGHDVKVGSYNTFMPLVRISGNTTIGNGNFFGVSSVVLQKIKIGDNTRIGAGSIIMTKTKDGELYMGNPAKKVRL